MDIVHDFWINAPRGRVFEAVSTEDGLNSWWTLESKADPQLSGLYELRFGPEYDWRARVTGFERDNWIEWTLVEATGDWVGTRVSLRLQDAAAGTTVQFAHRGWEGETNRYRISSYCWAMYLRLLKRFVQHNEVVDYKERLEA